MSCCRGHILKFINFYAIGACVVALMMISHGLLGAFAERSFTEVKIVFSVIENLWVVVALIAFVFSILRKVSILSSLMYLIYYALIFLLGISLVLMHLKDHTLVRGMSISMPLWLYVLDGIIGLIYLLVNILLVRNVAARNAKPSPAAAPSSTAG